MTPKFKLGDKVWLIYNYKAREATITGVHHTEKRGIHYNLKVDAAQKESTFDEEVLFLTKEELLASL